MDSHVSSTNAHHPREMLRRAGGGALWGSESSNGDWVCRHNENTAGTIHNFLASSLVLIYFVVGESLLEKWCF